MTVETTIQRMFDEWPDSFFTRQGCYDFLFCAIGNGYEWKRGQIVECEYENTDVQSMIDAEEKDYASNPSRAKEPMESPEHMAERKEFERMDALLKEYRIRHGESVPKSEKWYPICEYSLIKNVPSDIRPDWAKAVEECRNMLKEDGIEVLK